MQFKYPELLWALLLLVIPIIIHLFQLRKFKKTPFTNVKLLKKVVSESRKSSSIKKWLILFTRIGIIAALVLAFAQPFEADTNALLQKERIFYLDNSFSMQVKNQGSTLLQELVQDFIKNVPEGEKFTLLTNDKVYAAVSVQDIKNELLQLPVSSKQLSLEEIVLTAETYFKKTPGVLRNIIILSDFQKRMGSVVLDTNLQSNVHYVKPRTGQVLNVSIDSVYVGTPQSNSMELTAVLSANEPLETMAVSLYNGDKLIAKTAAKFNANKKAAVVFSVPNNTAILGKIIVSDTGLDYDNRFYFNLDTPDKIKVASIGSESHNFLSRIFTKDEFTFSNITLNELNYGSIDDYNLIILNELKSIPTALGTALRNFTKNEGHLTLIPATDMDVPSINQFSSGYYNTRYGEQVKQEILLDKVIFDHPLFTNVFEKKVTNFQYPKINQYHSLNSSAPAALRFQNNAAFLLGKDNAYFFSASLSKENSNFKNSPLIVPTFYNMGLASLKLPELYSILGSETTIEIPVSLSKDNVLKLVNGNAEFIPQQRMLPKKVQLSFKENPAAEGIYEIKNEDRTLKNISFNYDRKESELLYNDLSGIPKNRLHESVTLFFEESQRKNYINEFWKWFAILALLFVVMETIFQKLLK